MPKSTKGFLVLDLKKKSTLAMWAQQAGGKVVISDYAVSQDLKGFLADLKDKPPVILTMEEGVQFRTLEMPPMPVQEERKAILWDLKSKLGLDPETHYFIYSLLAETSSEAGSGERMFGVFFMEKGALAERIGLFKLFGLELAALVPGVSALARWTAEAGFPEPDKDLLIVDIGEARTSIFIARDGKVMFMRTVGFGGQEAPRLDESAESSQSDYMALVRPYLDKLLGEIKRTVDFYESQKIAQPVSKVFFAGGGAGLKGLLEFMGQFLGLAVGKLEIPQDWLSMASLDKKEALLKNPGIFQSAAAVATYHRSAVDVLPKQAPQGRITRLKQFSAKLTFFVTTAVLALFSVHQFFLLKVSEGDLLAAQKEWVEMKKISEGLEDIRHQEQFRVSVLKGDVYLPGLLKELSRRMSSTMALEEIKYSRKDQTIILRGSVLATGEKNEVKILAEFMNSLSGAPFFNSAELIQSGQGAPGQGSKFEIRCVAKTLA